MIRIRASLVAALACAAVAGGLAPSAAAQDAEPSTPRSSLRGFLVAVRAGELARAANHLDLSRIPAAQRAERGPELAWQLKTVLDRKLWVDLDEISDDPAGDPDDGLAPGRDRVGVIGSAAGDVPVLLERAGAEAGAEWRIAAATVARVPALYDEFGYGKLGEILPAVFFEEQFLEVQLWQWLGLGALVLAAWLGSWLAVRVALALARPVVSRSSTAIDDRLLAAAAGPLRLIVAVMVVSAGSYALGLSVPAQAVVNGAALIGGITAAAWLALRFVDLVAGVVQERMQAAGQSAARQFVPLGRKTVKVAVVALAALAALDSFGFDVTALIAGLGLGGLAVALALQKTLENLFGGATVLADRPVQVGDFCRFGDKVGTIEEIGIRSTRIRTLDRTLVTVPNADFAAMQLENFARRDKIWYNPTIGVRYETTPDQMRHVLAEMRSVLREHPKVDPDGARVRFKAFGAFSLDLEIFAYVRVTDYAEFLEVAEDLNLRMMDVVADAGTDFAFPSSTTYLAQDGGLDAEKAQAAEAKGRQSRPA